MKKYEILCNGCGHTWQSDFDDLNESCEFCFGDDLVIISEAFVDPTCCPKCEGLWKLGHLPGCKFMKDGTN